MSNIRLDESYPPLVLSVFRGKQTFDELERYIEAMNAMYARRRRYLGVSLMLDYAPDPAQMRRIAAWTRATKPQIEELCVANAIVAPSPGFRFILSSLLMIQPLPVRYQVVSDVDEAASWVTKVFVEDGRTAPARMSAYLHEQMALERTAHERR